MPIDSYDRYFGGKVGAAARALEGMRRTYGSEEEAQRVFRATMNKRRALGKGNGVRAILTERARRQAR